MDPTPERTLTYITIHLLLETVSIQSTDPEHLKQLASALVACADEMTMTGIGKAVPA